LTISKKKVNIVIIEEKYDYREKSRGRYMEEQQILIVDDEQEV